MRFSICLLEPEGYRYSHFLYDLCKYFCYTIDAAGYECCMVKNTLYADRINIIMGAHYLTNPDTAEQIKRSGQYIIMQTELLREGGISAWPDHPSYRNIYIPLMQQAFAVWNGLDSSLAYLHQLGIHAERAPRFGYLPALEEVRHKKEKDIDFLYYGTLTPHRQKMIEELKQRGGKVVCLFDEAAIFRNDYIARTRINLAPIQAPEKDNLTQRVLFLLNNRCIVAVEHCHDQDWVEHCFPSADTGHWVDLCMETLHRPDLDQLAEEYYQRYRQLDLVYLFQPLLDGLKMRLSGPSKGKVLLSDASPKTDGHAPETNDSSLPGFNESAIIPEGKNPAVLKATELAGDYYARGKLDQAVETLIDCIKVAPEAKEIYHELARIFIESKKFAEAWDVISSMPDTAKEDIKTLEYAGYAKEGLQLDNEAAVYADRLLSANAACPAALNLKGVLAYKKGDREEAAVYFQKAMDADSNDGEAYTNLGVLSWGLDKKEEALALLEKGFSLSSTVPDVSSLYYSILVSLGLFSKAEDDFKKASTLYPNHKNLAFLYIDLLLRQDKYDVAIKQIEDAIAIFGPDEETLAAASVVRKKLGLIETDIAMKENDQAP